MTTAYQAKILFVKIVIVISNVSHRNHAFAMVLVYRRIDAVGCDTTDVGIEFFT